MTQSSEVKEEDILDDILDEFKSTEKQAEFKDELSKQMQNFLENLSEEKDLKDNFTNTLNDTLNRLKLSKEETINPQENFNPEDLNFNSLIDEMMQQLMSKEILYEPLKELSQKYPDWLKINKSLIEKEEYEKYEKQFEYCLKVVKCYEQGKIDYEKICEMIQKMQECGSPPADIIKDLAPGLELGEDGLPKLPTTPGNGGECSIM